MSLPHLQTALDRLLSTVSSAVGHILDRALAGADITVDEATSLFDADGSDLPALTAAADYLRAKTEERHLGADPVYRDYQAFIARDGLLARLRRGFRYPTQTARSRRT